VKNGCSKVAAAAIRERESFKFLKDF